MHVYNLSGNNALFYTASFGSAYVTQLYINGLPFLSDHSSQDYTFITTASITNLSSTNASIANISGATAYYTTLSSTNACIYNLSGNNASF